jgi:hypothetical protein
MKHARKMVLVDYDKHMHTYKPEHELDTAPKPLYGLQHEMTQVLEDKRLSDYEKQNRYLRKLNRFLYMNQAKKKQHDEEMLDMQRLKKEFLQNSLIKKEKIKTEPKSYNFYESDDSDQYMSITNNKNDDEFDETVIDKRNQGAIPKTPLQSTPKNNDQSGSPYEIFEKIKLRNRDVIKRMRMNDAKKAKQAANWKSFENINKSVTKN